MSTKDTYSSNAVVIPNFPKIDCPFIRREFAVDENMWKKYGSSYQLRRPVAYLVVNEINPGYEWVFEYDDVVAKEKLDGTNIQLLVVDGRLVHMQNRKNIVDPLQISKGKTHLIEGVFRAIQKGYIDSDGEYAGEVIGPKLQGNPYKLDNHIFYPFHKTGKYKSFHTHDRTFDNWSSWFKDYLFSLFAQRKYGHKEIMAEGVVLYSMKRKAEGKPYMAKLRRDMFPWYYEPQINIIDYPDNPQISRQDST